ncbi:MAG: hypothetical protein JWP96_597 [Polaromonas sp.]|nr:hypothetical protein [Polaromonas sp.]
MNLPISGFLGNEARRATSLVVNLAPKRISVPARKEKRIHEKHDKDEKKRGIPPARHDLDEDDVIGEIERPQQPSEKPESS